ncbi:hypothetical protein PV04_04755 [Phialophora macrospora]|uniref:C2 domain-containing protein n=1 Tax=Phialophora macrospora TaxID=1851006 RepID=A0A0D2FQJ7_9EURO|nr:hypothetical protein PV04_04755 [Phialophora macrospora]
MATRAKGINAAHTAGIFADMTLDGPEIGTLVAVVDRAKNLPNRKTMGKQDPYCAMRLGKDAKKTDTDKRGGQTPRWDQELRFTVHDSPDYYKLKCSVFNDDKKTDLISEAWIDLQDVIVPGGGQSDQWRQLNFKGKYAGDIRIELTYYDTRPKPDLSAESKKQRDKSHSVASDAPNSASGPRQIGPRDIKRRPLPPGPGGYSSPASAVPTTSERWSTEERPASYGGHGYTNSNPPPRPPKQKFVPETPDDVGYDLNPQFGPDSYEPQYESSLSYHGRHTSNVQNYESSIIPYPEPEAFPEDPYQSRSLPAQPIQSRPVSELPHPEQPFRSASQPPYDMPEPPLYRSPPATPPAAAMQNQQWNGRTSTSPTKYAAYRDSPLRQSISQADMPRIAPSYPDPRFDEDEPPPPPPAHRGQISRIAKLPSAQDDHDQPPLQAPIAASHRDSYGQQHPQTPVKFQKVEERSPLQRLEHECDQPQATTPPTQELQHQLPPLGSYELNLLGDHDRYPVFASDRRKSNNYDFHELRLTSSAGDVLPPEQLSNHNPIQRQYQERPRDDGRHPMGYATPRRAQTFDNFELQDERHLHRADLIVARPRAISPNPNHNIPRKSITPTLGTPGDRHSMGTVPYDPDSYDTLNPGTSPTVDNGGYPAAEDALEAARQQDVDKLQDQGPIIGNDGRVIDPSDHLPANTWAPEPERKQRKPEHVIKIRTREEARLHRGTGSSPGSGRPQSIANSPFQSSPHGPASSPYHSSPPAVPVSPQVESPSGRNRLRKPMPQRPLPTEPYTHPQSSPAVLTLPSVDPRPNPSSHRYSIHSSPAGGLPQQPPLSEYQVPAPNNHSPRGGSGGGTQHALDYRQEYTQQTPTKLPRDRQKPPEAMGYGGRPPYDEDNPLALELSRIDIGPSRMSRTTLRPQKAYGAY